MYIITYAVNLENQNNYEIKIRPPIEMIAFF